MPAEPVMTIGDAARRAGCSVETLRFYERIGVVAPPPRRGRYRIYGPGAVRRLAFVRRARELGFTLDQVKALLGLAGAGDAGCADARALAAAHLGDVRARIADLRAMEQVLADTIRACDSEGPAGCPLIKVLSASAA